ncbi:unnamed protein product [Amoebophrya sp. A25]|nr:unnamed protein product [Amoebophrya sp. A25]|eukprot:GSA25T00013903001.1
MAGGLSVELQPFESPSLSACANANRAIRGIFWLRWVVPTVSFVPTVPTAIRVISCSVITYILDELATT